MVIYYKYIYYQFARYAQKQTDLIIYVNLVVPYVYTIIENKSKKREWMENKKRKEAKGVGREQEGGGEEKGGWGEAR